MPWTEIGEAWFFIFAHFFSGAYLHDRSETCHLCQDRLTGTCVNTKIPSTAYTACRFKRFFYCLVKRTIEVRDHFIPDKVALSDDVKLFFDVRREVVVHHFAKVLKEKISDQQSHICRNQSIGDSSCDFGFGYFFNFFS